MGALTLDKRPVDAALLHRIGISVHLRVVDQLVHLLAQNLADALEAQHPGARGIREGAVTLQIDAIDPLTGGIEEQPHQLVGLSQLHLYFLPFGNVDEGEDAPHELAALLHRV